MEPRNLAETSALKRKPNREQNKVMKVVGFISRWLFLVGLIALSACLAPFAPAACGVQRLRGLAGHRHRH
jgi:hypothetical protein